MLKKIKMKTNKYTSTKDNILIGIIFLILLFSFIFLPHLIGKVFLSETPYSFWVSGLAIIGICCTGLFFAVLILFSLWMLSGKIYGKITRKESY